MDEHTTDLLQQRVKLGRKMDILFAQLMEVHQELQQVHGEISMAITWKGENVAIQNVISNFPGIMKRRMEMAIEGRLSPSKPSLEETFAQENVAIVSRLEAPIRPTESLEDYNRRVGNTVHKGRG
ncbi:MAG: hypothetical protein ACYC37_03465 [Desulfobacteria bacterium]